MPASTLVASRRFALICLLLLLAAMEVLYLTTEHQMNAAYGFSLDDSWIHAVFARNLAEGRGYTFNLHETVSASTAPLFTALLAGWYLVAGEVVGGAKLIGILGLAAAAFFLYLSTERLAGRTAAWLAAALCILSPALLIGSLSGMEIGLYMVSPCAALYAFTRQRYVWMIFALALGVWLRPEALLLLGLGWLAVPKEKKLVTAAMAAAVVLPYFAMNLALSHYPLPVTVRTKSHLASAHFSANFLKESQLLFLRFHWLPLLLIAPLGWFKMDKRAWWVAVFPAVLYVATWSMHATSSSFCRYLHPMLPYLYVAIAVGLAWAAEKWGKKGVVVWLVIAVLLAMQGWTAYKMSWLHGMAVKNIADMQITVAQIAARTTAPDDIVATNDVGAVGYFSGRYVLDLVGLVSPQRPFGENIREHQPTFVAIFDAWFPQRQEPVFADNYKFLGYLELKQNVVCGDSRMTLYARNDRYDDVFARLKGVAGDYR